MDHLEKEKGVGTEPGGAESKGKEASNGIIMAYEGVVVDGIYSCSCSYWNYYSYNL